jgi:hypothetical protein
MAELNPRQEEQQAEPVEAAMWAAMEGLAWFSQASVIHCIGVFVRLETIRIEKHQTRFQPLQLYMNEKFTRWQREAWEALVEATE